MTRLLKSIKEKHSRYYTYRGIYRKHLMKQESANTAEIYDYFSKLTIRLNNILKCKELQESSDTHILEVQKAVPAFRIDISEVVSLVLSAEGDHLHKIFGEAYDTVASVVEGMEIRVSKYLDTVAILSEDAKLIQRRTHFKKNHAKNSRRSMSAKMAWKKNKHKYLKAVKKFHKSSEGKQFHRNLSRFNKRKKGESWVFLNDDVMHTSKGISSMLTHLLIEMQNTVTDNIESDTGEVKGYVENLREVFYIFNELMLSIVDAYFDEDKESTANVIEVISEYYDMAEGDLSGAS